MDIVGRVSNIIWAIQLKVDKEQQFMSYQGRLLSAAHLTP